MNTDLLKTKLICQIFTAIALEVVMLIMTIFFITKFNGLNQYICVSIGIVFVLLIFKSATVLAELELLEFH